MTSKCPLSIPCVRWIKYGKRLWCFGSQTSIQPWLSESGVLIRSSESGWMRIEDRRWVITYFWEMISEWCILWCLSWLIHLDWVWFKNWFILMDFHLDGLIDSLIDWWIGLDFIDWLVDWSDWLIWFDLIWFDLIWFDLIWFDWSAWLVDLIDLIDGLDWIGLVGWLIWCDSAESPSDREGQMQSNDLKLGTSHASFRTSRCGGKTRADGRPVICSFKKIGKKRIL